MRTACTGWSLVGRAVWYSVSTLHALASLIARSRARGSTHYAHYPASQDSWEVLRLSAVRAHRVTCMQCKVLIVITSIPRSSTYLAILLSAY